MTFILTEKNLAMRTLIPSNFLNFQVEVKNVAY